MRTYGQYCPIARTAEILGDRWTLLIVRDMLVGTTRFNELARGLPGLSRGLLSKRLSQLERAGILERRDAGYHLTDAGEGLRPLVFGMGEWGAQHAFGDPIEDELDPDLLLWWMHRRIDVDALPDRRVVLEVDVRDRRRRYWLVVDGEGVSICLSDPGFDVDARIRSDLASLYRAYAGRSGFLEEVRAGTIELVGGPSIVKAVTRALLMSPIAGMVGALTPRP